MYIKGIMTVSCKILQSWEGRVVEILEDEFSAILEDETNPELNEEIVTLDKNVISPNDLKLLKEGAVFYWTIGYCDPIGRGRLTFSEIRFRRLINWSKDSVKQALKRGAELAEIFRGAYPNGK
jgi:hypothetical protein